MEEAMPEQVDAQRRLWPCLKIVLNYPFKAIQTFTHKHFAGAMPSSPYVYI